MGSGRGILEKIRKQLPWECPKSLPGLPAEEKVKNLKALAINLF